MGLSIVVDKFFEENIGGAIIHGLMLPFCMASDIPRLVRNYKNSDYPPEVYRSSKFSEYKKTHPGPPHRFTARSIAAMVSVYATMGAVQLADIPVQDVIGFMVLTNVASLAYADIPVVKKAVKGTAKLAVDACYALSRYCV